MATTNIRPIKRRLDHVLKYAGNEIKTENKDYGEYSYKDLHNVIEYAESDYKTEKKYYVTGINCTELDAYDTMLATKKAFKKEDGILAFHLIQSFDEGEVTPELAHKIGIELSNELFADRFECVVATHLNTKHYHNHIIINSVSFVDGRKYYDNHETYSAIRKVSDNLCKQYGLKVLEEKKTKKTNLEYSKFYKKYERNNSYKSIAKRDIDFAIAQAYSFEDFKFLMKKLDYEVIFRSGKISIRGKNYNRNIRIERAFGEEYSIENIKRRILEETSTRVPFIEAYKIKGTTNHYRGNFKKSKVKATGIIALYYHYCFLLKVFPNTNNVNRKLPASIRADVSKMESYSNQAKFLNKYKINTISELNNFKNSKTSELNSLLSERESLWRYRKLETDENKKKFICNKISNINKTISEIRKEMMLIESITERIPKIKENLQEMKIEENERKEKLKDERTK